MDSGGTQDIVVSGFQAKYGYFLTEGVPSGTGFKINAIL